jgi:hypothetical protein
MLLSASSNAPKVAFNYGYPFISHAAIHKLAKSSTPSMFTDYKHALMLFNIYNSEIQSTLLHLNQVFPL